MLLIVQMEMTCSTFSLKLRLLYLCAKVLKHPSYVHVCLLLEKWGNVEISELEDQY